MTDMLIVLVLLAVVGLAAGYIIGAKKKGKKCIGCPCAGQENCHCNGR